MSNKIKKLSLAGLFLLLNLHFFGQIISGKVVSASKNEPLIYAGVGVIESSYGTITNEEGKFRVDVKGLPMDKTIKFSMIGYKSKTYTIEELSGEENTIFLEGEVYNLPDVVIKPGGKLSKVGTTRFSYKRGFCGWAGNEFGKGWEIGTKIDLGDYPKCLKSLHIRVYKQSFDSSLFRLHIRSITDSLPENELLKTNILLTITRESGWITFDLDKYNLVFDGEIALSLEWIKVFGLDDNRLVKSDGVEQSFYAVTFNIKREEGITLYKWGTEAKWSILEKSSPSIYLTVQ